MPSQMVWTKSNQICSSRFAEKREQLFFLSIQTLEPLLGTHHNGLMIEHICPLVRVGQLQLRSPESAKYPRQAYMAGNLSISEEKHL